MKLKKLWNVVPFVLLYSILGYVMGFKATIIVFVIAGSIVLLILFCNYMAEN